MMLLLPTLVVALLSHTAVQSASLVYASERLDPQTVELDSSKLVTTSQKLDPHVYLFVSDGKKRPYSFVDDFGKLVGFDLDIVNEVCSLAGTRCHTVLAEFTECIFTDKGIDYAGRGLMAAWFDGCPGYQITTDRQNEFDFTLPYLDSTASFTVAPGNPSGFNPDSGDYTAFTIIHLTGAPTNAICLNRLHKKFGRIIIAQDLPEAKLALLNGTLLPHTASCSIRQPTSEQVPVLQDKVILRGTMMLLLPTLVVALLSHTAVQSASLVYTSERLDPQTVELDSWKLVTTSQKLDPHVYLFVTDGKKRPYSFVDDFGKLVGFDLDIVNEVCSLAGTRCHTVLAEFTECIFTDKGIDYAGRGLMAAWFDGCPGYQITTDRQNEFDFTLPYLDSTASFTVAPGNPSGFNPDSGDYTAFTIIHLTGAPTNAICLNRLHKKFGRIIIAQDLPEAKLALLNRTADVLFSPRNAIEGLDVLPQRYRCDKGGAGIMLKKGSSIPSWWNTAFQAYYFSGAYANLCSQASVKYGVNINCLPSPTMMSPELSAILRAATAPVPEKLWRFIVSGRIFPYSFLNDEGVLMGFTKSLLDAVCQIAGKACVLLLQPVPECSVRKGDLLYPGRGLMEGWFDACTGYFNTQDRANSWDFTSPYLVSNASFYVANGNPTGFNPDADDYSFFSIVYQATAITNNHCLNRLHKKFNKLIVVEIEEDAIQMVINRTADTWFTKEIEVSQLERLPQRLHCENVGTSIMTRKGGELPSWWNVAFNEFYSTGGYQNFCQDQTRQYNFQFPCVEGPRNISAHRPGTFEGF